MMMVWWWWLLLLLLDKMVVVVVVVDVVEQVPQGTVPTWSSTTETVGLISPLRLPL